MAIEYHTNERDELITLTASGAVSSSEACGCIENMLNDPAFNAQLPQLIDLRTAEPSGTDEELANFETFLLGDYQPRLGSTVAIVVNDDWDESTCAKAFWISCALGLAELFDNWNQACKWLVTREFTADMTDIPGLEDLDEVFEEAFYEDHDDVEEETATAATLPYDSDDDLTTETVADAETETAVTTDSATPQG